MIDLIEANIKEAIEAAKAGKRVVVEDAPGAMLVAKYLEEAERLREQLAAMDEKNWSIRRALVAFVRACPWVTGRDCVNHIWRTRPLVQNDTIYSTLSKLCRDGKLHKKKDLTKNAYLYAIVESES